MPAATKHGAAQPVARLWWELHFNAYWREFIGAKHKAEERIAAMEATLKGEGK